MKAAMIFLASAALVCAPAPARAADYPSKPITLMIGFAPGGPSDVMARILTKKMEEILKQPLVIENRAGAGGSIAGAEVAKRYDRPQPGQQVIVRTKAGVLVTVTQPINPALRVGQRVYIEGAGEGARVLPQ